MRKIRCRPIRRSVLAAAVVAGLLVGQAGPAQAGLLGGLLGTVTGVVGGLTGVLTAGWDDGATTPPVKLSTVAAAINADDLWARGITGRGVDVALIDTGVVPLQGLSTPGKVLNGPDLSFDSQVDELRYLDGYGHGTHMAGIIAGYDGTSSGFKGIAPGSRLVNVRVGSGDGAVDVTQVIAAIDWVVQNRASDGMNIRVINLSFGTDSVQPAQLDPLAFAVEAAWRNGVVVVVGGGNDGTNRPLLVNPATNPFVVAVGAVDLQNTASVSDDKVATFSSRGSSSRYVDLVAPGVSITSLRDPGSTIDVEHPGSVVEERYVRGSGTSQAAAVTSGAVALMLQARPSLTPDQVKALLRATATPVPDTATRAQGRGRLNIDLAARTSISTAATQPWTAGAGTGSLEASRGTSHVAADGIELVGEQDIFGVVWDGAAWARGAATATNWSGGMWRGSQWTGACWCTTSWSGVSWEGHRWTGHRWTGHRWTDSEWTGHRWTGHRWTTDEWNGHRWTGHRWTGNSWTGSAWA